MAGFFLSQGMMGDFYFLLLVISTLQLFYNRQALENFNTYYEILKNEDTSSAFVLHIPTPSQARQELRGAGLHSKYLIWREGTRAARKQPSGQKQSEGGRILKVRAVNLGIK